MNIPLNLGNRRELMKKRRDGFEFLPIKKTRSGYNKDLEFVLKPVFIMLKGFQVSQKDQINFIYDLFFLNLSE